MRIVWINKSPWRKPGPIVPMGVQNAAACARLGHPTDLFLSATEPVDPAEVETDLCQFYGLGDVPEPLTVHLLPAHSLLPPRPVYRHALRHLRRLLRDDDQPVLALTREEGLLPALLHLRDRAGGRLRVVHETHDFFADLSHLEKPDWSARRRQQLARHFFPRLNGLLCLTDEQVRLHLEHLSVAPPLLALPLGTDERPTAEPELLLQRRTLAYVGHLHAAKGRQTILEAAAGLSRLGIHLLLLGGNDEQVTKLQTQFDKRMTGTGRARVRPFLPPAEMHRVLAQEASAGLILLTDTFYNRNLTCPVKALDTLSHGLPALASNLPSCTQVLRDAALYLPPGDAPSLVHAAAELFDSAAPTFARLAQASRRRAQELLWAERARRIVQWQGGDTPV